jgi:hypothetical protein
MEAKDLGYGGVSAVSKISKISRVTIHRGLKELLSPVSRKIEQRQDETERQNSVVAETFEFETRDDAAAAFSNVVRYMKTEDEQSDELKAVLASNIAFLMKSEGATVSQTAERAGLDASLLSASLSRPTREISLYEMLGCVHALGYALRVEAVKNGKTGLSQKFWRAGGPGLPALAMGERGGPTLAPQRPPAPPAAASNDRGQGVDEYEDEINGPTGPDPEWERASAEAPQADAANGDQDEGPFPWDDEYGNEAQENKKNDEDLPF